MKRDEYEGLSLLKDKVTGMISKSLLVKIQVKKALEEKLCKLPKDINARKKIELAGLDYYLQIQDNKVLEEKICELEVVTKAFKDTNIAHENTIESLEKKIAKYELQLEEYREMQKKYDILQKREKKYKQIKRSLIEKEKINQDLEEKLKLSELRNEENKTLEDHNRTLEEEVSKYEQIIDSYREKDKIISDLEESVRVYESQIQEYKMNQAQATVLNDAVPYDCILDIENFSTLNNSGWVLEINNSSIKENISGSILSIVGMYHRGKTFLLNKLANSEIGTSKNLKTKGLSFKIIQIEESKFVFIDTAGFNSPVNANKIPEHEKKYTETFIQELSFRLGNHFIVVVNDFTLTDQKFLSDLVQNTLENKEKQSILVIHNFKDIEDQVSHFYEWKSQVLDIFQSEGGSGAQTIQVNLGNSSKGIHIFKTKSTTHISLVNDKCLYGQEYNMFSIECIKQMLKFQYISSTQENIYENIKLNLNEALKMEIKFTREEVLRLLDKENNECEINETEKPCETDIKSDSSRFSYREIVTLESRMSDEEYQNFIVGQTKFNKFEPLVDLVFHEDYYQIYLDLPGMAEGDDISISWDENVRISGNRKRDFDDEVGILNRKFGQFELSFKIPKQYKQKTKKIKMENGVLVLHFDKAATKIWQWGKKN